MTGSGIKAYIPSVLALLTGSAVIAYTAITGYDYRVNQSVNAYSDRAGFIADEVRHYIGTLQFAATTVRDGLERETAPIFTPQSAEKTKKTLRNVVQALPHVGHVAVLDETGKIWVDIGIEAETEDGDLSNTAFFDQHKRQNDRTLHLTPSPPRTQGRQGALVISLATRDKNGQLLGVIVSYLDEVFFADLSDHAPSNFKDAAFFKVPGVPAQAVFDTAGITAEHAARLSAWLDRLEAQKAFDGPTNHMIAGDYLYVAAPVKGWDIVYSAATAMAPIRLAAIHAIAPQITLAASLVMLFSFFLGFYSRRTRAARQWADTVEQLKNRLAFATENAGIGIWTYEIGSDELLWDTQMHHLYRRSPASTPLRYEDWRAYLVPESQKTWTTDHLSAINMDERRNRFQILRGDGELRWIQSIAHMQCTDEGVPARIIGVNFDTTAEVEALQHLEEERNRLARLEQRFRGAFEHVPHGTIISSVSGEIQTLNSSTPQIFGYPGTDLVGRDIKILFPDEMHDQIARILKDAETSDDDRTLVRSLAVTGRRADGRTFPLSANVGSMTPGKEKLLIWSLDDETERQAMEAQLRQAMRMEAAGQLTGGIAHDFNNLLVTMAGSAELLEDAIKDREEAIPLLRSINRSVDRATALTSRLLSFTRQQQLRPTAISVKHTVTDIEDLITRSLGESIEFRTHLREGLWAANVDENQLENALLNLCLNARDAMPDGGTLIIEATNVTLEETEIAFDEPIAAGEYVSIAVSDTGTGIPPDIRKRIFEPFFTTKSDGKGSGLGLSMVYGFARQSGGQVTIYSETGEGTTVRLYLPRANKEPVEVAVSPPAEAPVRLADTRVLIVEDNPDVRSIPSTILQRDGCDVIECTNAGEAIEILAKEDGIDLLFSDIGLPGGMNGIQLAEEVARRYPDIKILLTTGYAQDLLEQKHKDAATRSVLSKPYRRQDLLRAISALLGKS